MARDTTAREDKEFCELLDDHVIEVKLSYALRYGDATPVLAWVESNFDPQDIFDVSELEAWAKSNGYVLED